MTFNDYQKAASKFNKINEEHKLWYLPLGICGESGEIANKVKKIIRDHGYRINPEISGEIADELGDVLWYLSEMARFFGFNLEYLAEKNIIKLKDREQRNKIGGSGDKR